MKKAKRFLSLLLTLCMLLVTIPSNAMAANSTLPFRDVQTSDWFYQAVEYVYENGMMSGTNATTFSPNETVTRGMIVTILHRIEGTPDARGETFTDVSPGAYYQKAAAWTSAHGIVTGYGNGAFGPNDAITREQLATILYRYAQHKGYDLSATGNVSSYRDGRLVNAYAVTALNWATGFGLISGVGSNKLDPSGSATRAQAATILMRFCNLFIENDEPVTPPPVVGDGEYTRGEWIQALAEKLGMNLSADPADIEYYYVDVIGSEYGIAIETAQAYGILPQPDLEDLEQDIPYFYPDDTATREFAAYTAVKAMGFDGTHSFSIANVADRNRLSFPDEVAIALGYGFLSLNNGNYFDPDTAITTTDVYTIFAAIDELNASIEVAPEDAYDNTELASGIIKDELADVTDYTVIDNGDSTYTVTLPQTAATSSIAFEKVIVLPPSEEYVTGIALKVTALSTQGNNLILTCIEPELHEVLTHISFAGTGTAEVDNVVTPEGITYEYDPNGSIDDGSAATYALGRAKIDVNESIAIPGTLKFNLAKYKFNDDLNVTGNVTIEIPKVTCIVDANIGFFKFDLDEFTLSVQEKIKFDATLTYTLAESGYELTNSAGNTRWEKGRVELGRLPIAIGTTGLSFDIVFFYNVEAKGTASISYTIVSTQGYQYKNGTSRAIFDYDDSLDFLELKGSAKAGLGFSGVICAFSLMDLIGYSVEAGVAFNASFTPHVLATNTLFCGDVTLYAYCSSGLDTETAVGKFLDKVCNYTLEFEHLKNDSKNPFKLKLHLENAHLVDECSFGLGGISGYVASLDGNIPIENARINIYNGAGENSDLLRTLYTNSDGKYSLDNLTDNTYKVVVSATGFYTYEVMVTVKSCETTYIENLLMVDRSGGGKSSLVTGTITDAVTGEGISGTSYVLRKGWNTTSGEAVASGTFDNSTYSMSLGIGNYTLEVKKHGYITNYTNIAVSETACSGGHIVLSPDNISVNGDSMRIVLTWGELPWDLDSHLFGPSDSGNPYEYHVAFFYPYYYEGDSLVADLDVDDTESFGPETITLHSIDDSGVYSYYVHDYTNLENFSSKEMSRSNAKVQVYVGNQVIASYSIPANVTGTVWHVFDYNAATGQLIPVNTFHSSANPDTLDIAR